LILSTTATAAEPARPNILIILADDMGFSDAGCYGGEIATPNLDALARNGLRFTQFYNTARCWPSRAALLTGYYAQEIRRDTVPGIKSGSQGTRPAWARLLPEMLRPLGYRCYHSGKWHVDGLPLQNGFDHSYSLNDHDRHFAPKKHTEDDKPLPPVDPKSGYYTTTAIAEHAIKCL
jgi:arylsulfatase